MIGKLKKWLERWGYMLMCVLCAAVVLLSALWTKSANEQTETAQNALHSMDETLKEHQETQRESLCAPCEGDMIRPFSLSAVYFDKTGMYGAHPGIDFDTEPGSAVYAMLSGTVTVAADGCVCIREGEWECRVLGLEEICCGTGERVNAGDKIGTAGGHVPFEGAGHVCAQLIQNGAAVDFAALLP